MLSRLQDEGRGGGRNGVGGGRKGGRGLVQRPNSLHMSFGLLILQSAAGKYIENPPFPSPLIARI